MESIDSKDDCQESSLKPKDDALQHKSQSSRLQTPNKPLTRSISKTLLKSNDIQQPSSKRLKLDEREEEK